MTMEEPSRAGFDLAASLAAAKRQNAEDCVKTWEDLDRYRRAITRARPDGILEVGTFSGKSALWFARTARAPVFSVDVNPQVDEGTWRAAAEAGVTFWTGNSLDPATWWQAHEWAARAQVARPMVVLDGDHSADTVYREMCHYGRMVRPGGYLVVEDGLVRWMPWEQHPQGPYRGSPLDAIERFMREHWRHWRIDTALEAAHPATQFPSGWLERTG